LSNSIILSVSDKFSTIYKIIKKEFQEVAIFIGVFCVAVCMDLRFYKIPNLCILTGVVSGLIMTFVSYSVVEMLGACIMMGVIFMAFYPFYLLGGLGAGDIKLLMMTACFIQKEHLIKYLLVTFALAAGFSIFKMLLFAESRERLFYLGRYLKKAALTGSIENYVVDKRNRKCVIRLSIPAFISLIIMCLGGY